MKAEGENGERDVSMFIVNVKLLSFLPIKEVLLSKRCSSIFWSS